MESAGVPSTEMVIVRAEVLSLPAEFVASTVKVYVPALVGVPPRTPAEVKVSPDGSAPLATEKVMGAVPEAAKV